MPTSRNLERYRPLFARLRILGDAAAMDAALAIDSADRDPSNSLVKSRRVTEAILKDLIGVDAEERDLTIEKMKGRLQRVPRKVMTYVEVLQRLGNAGAHHGTPGLTPADAHNALAALHELADWYLHTHLGNPRPRSRAPWVVAGLVLGFVAVALVGAGAWWFAGRVPSPTTHSAAAAPPSEPVVALAEPVAPPVEVASVEVSGVPLWSRPWMRWEARERPLRGAAVAPGRPVKVCDGGLSGISVVATVGAWVRVQATCDGVFADGWAEATALGRSPAPDRSAEPIVYAGEAKNLFYEAGALLDAEHWAEAEIAYDRLVVLVPHDPQLYERRGLARLRAENPSGALDDLGVCLALAPKSGRCHLYAAEALKALDDPEWNQVLSDAVAYDPTLADEAKTLRGGGTPAADVRTLQGAGRLGVPLCTRIFKAMSGVRRIQEGARGADPREVCRLYDGDTVEVLSTDGDWHKVRVRCDGEVREGFLPGELDGRTILSR